MLFMGLLTLLVEEDREKKGRILDAFHGMRFTTIKIHPFASVKLDGGLRQAQRYASFKAMQRDIARHFVRRNFVAGHNDKTDRLEPRRFDDRFSFFIL